jgi:hypothetical protein
MGRNEMTEDEAAQLARDLASLRLGYYQGRAQEISVYAGLDVLPPEVPRSVPLDPPTVETCFHWQFDFWTIADLLKAVDNANTVDGQRTTVDRSVVKRIERITLQPLVPERRQDPSGYGEQPVVAVNPITGRSGGPDNPHYDVRNARMTLIVSSARLPDLVNAIARTNFMTVIGLQFEEVDIWPDLEQGYYYGLDHVIRATLDIETVWLRDWTAPLMPPRIRGALTGSEAEPDFGGAG